MQLCAVISDHALLDLLVLLIQLKCLLPVEGQRLELASDLICDRHDIEAVKELVLEKLILFVLRKRLYGAPVEATAPRADSLEIVEAERVHQQLYLVFYHGVKGTVKKLLGCALLHVNNFFDHHWYLLLVNFLLVMGGMHI